MNRYIVFLTDGKRIEIEAEQAGYSERTRCIIFYDMKDNIIARFTLENIAGYAKTKHIT